MVGASSTDADLALLIAQEILREGGTGVSKSREISRKAIGDCFGVMIAGSALSAAQIAARVRLEEPRPGFARLIGTRHASTPEWAALVNGIAAHVLDFDDGHPTAMAHPSAVLLPAALAMAEAHGLSGAAVIGAHAAGVRVFAAFGAVVNPAHYFRGWHATSSIGTLAAAACVAVLLRLGPDQTAHALGIAATQSSGLRRNFGSMTKSFHAGWAAHAGVAAAMLASQGFTAGSEVLEGPDGWLDLMVGNGEGRARAIMEQLRGNRDTAALAMSLKRFAACGTTHTPLEAVLRIRDEEQFLMDDVEVVNCYVNPATFDILRTEEPRSGLEGKFSLEHCIAVALIDGSAGPLQFTDDRVSDPRVRALALRVRVHASENLRTTGGSDADVWAAEVGLVLSNGRAFARHVARRRGAFSFEPLSDRERRDKFLGSLEFVGCPNDRADSLFELLEGLEQIEDIRDLTASVPVVPEAVDSATRG